ncbi:MAG: Nif3-like dinuclear metal center hexameric protein [Clostridia bacterium]|nr:Nif3-like dinuclear metal center hexameric protein [Clostridia bacterium]
MKAKEIFEKLLSDSYEVLENTCDGLIAGDEDKEVKKIGTCFKLTAELICAAKEGGVDMIITHEPTFSHGDLRENAFPVDLKKWALLDESGITVYRFHDHAHHRETDYIHAGFIKALDLKIKHKYPPESLGVRRYELDEEITTAQLAKRTADVLGIEFVRVVGRSDHPVKTVCLGLGGVGFDQINKLFDPGCDLFITGEVGEVCVAEYLRDACFFGEEKSLLVLGHYSSEFSGMKLLAEDMNKTFGNTVFLDGKEVYYRI